MGSFYDESGPLIIANTSMTTLSHWAGLKSINSLGNTTATVDGVPYSFVVTG